MWCAQTVSVENHWLFWILDFTIWITELTEKTHATAFLNYWSILCIIMIWFPLLIMIISFGFIYYKLSKSLKAFPYLSIQSKVARSRKKVIHMLLFLIIVEIICWIPWQSWIIFNLINWNKYKDTDPEEVPDVNQSFPSYWSFSIWSLFSVYELLEQKNWASFTATEILYGFLEQCNQSIGLWLWKWDYAKGF